MLLSKAVEGFLFSLQSEGKSPKYLQNLAWDLKRLTVLYGHLQIEEITTSTLREYLAFHQERGLAIHSLHAIYKDLSVFYSWCEREEVIAVSPLHRLRAPILPQVLPKVLSASQVTGILHYLKKQRTKVGKRNYTIVAMFLDTGLRVSELAQLTNNDVHLPNAFLVVRKGKGGKDRAIPISNTLRKVLWKYLTDIRPRFHPESNHLFLGFESKPLNKNAVMTMVKRTLRECDVPHGGPHVFRHTFATLYLRNGGDLERLRQILGHASLTTTQVYLHLVPEDLIRRHNEISPLASVM